MIGDSIQFSSVQSPSRVRLFETPWITARQAYLSIINSPSLLKLRPTESVMPSSHLILCRPLLLLPPIPPSVRVFSNESTLCLRWPKYWSFSFSISPFSEHPGLISFRMDWLWVSLQSKGLSRVFSNTTVQKHQFFGIQLSSALVWNKCGISEFLNCSWTNFCNVWGIGSFIFYTHTHSIFQEYFISRKPRCLQ